MRPPQGHRHTAFREGPSRPLSLPPLLSTTLTYFAVPHLLFMSWKARNGNGSCSRFHVLPAPPPPPSPSTASLLLFPFPFIKNSQVPTSQDVLISRYLEKAPDVLCAASAPGGDSEIKIGRIGSTFGRIGADRLDEELDAGLDGVFEGLAWASLCRGGYV